MCARNHDSQLLPKGKKKEICVFLICEKRGEREKSLCFIRILIRSEYKGGTKWVLDTKSREVEIT